MVKNWRANSTGPPIRYIGPSTNIDEISLIQKNNTNTSVQQAVGLPAKSEYTVWVSSERRQQSNSVQNGGFRR